MGLASLLATLAGAGLLGRYGRGRPPRSGAAQRLGHLTGDLKLGLLGFLAAALPVYAIQLLIVLIHHGFGEEPADHPLVEDAPRWLGGGTLAVAVLVAVCVAPIFEEFVFRLVLQGWLEKLAAMWVGAGAEHAVAVPNESGATEWETEDPTALPLHCPADSSDPQATSARLRPLAESGRSSAARRCSPQCTWGTGLIRFHCSFWPSDSVTSIIVRIASYPAL